MCGLAKTEWAHALAGGLSVRGAEGLYWATPNCARSGGSTSSPTRINKNRNKTKEKNMRYLIVVAHPDDEVLGAGASI